MKILRALHRFFFFRLAFLQDENARLHEELRRWQDAALKKEGLPPLTPQVRTQPLHSSGGRALPSQYRNRLEVFNRKFEQMDAKEKARA